MATYEIKVTKNVKKTGEARAWLLEDGSQIAHISREAGQNPTIKKYKWFSERAKIRFESYCDSISVGECVEALGFPS